EARVILGRAGLIARYRSWHIAICDIVEHGCGAGGDRLWAWAECDRLCAWYMQGLHDARRPWSVSHRPDGPTRRQNAGRAGPRVRPRDRARPPLRLVRRRARAAG